jgi:hypothetical protein
MFLEEMSMSARIKCPNCQSNVANHPENGCVLAALIQVIREREVIPERRLRTIHGATDVDRLWGDLGQVIDRLEEGGYAAH